MAGVMVVQNKVTDYGLGNKRFLRGVPGEVSEEQAAYLVDGGYFEYAGTTAKGSGGVKISTRAAKADEAKAVEV